MISCVRDRDYIYWAPGQTIIHKLCRGMKRGTLVLNVPQIVKPQH